MLNAEFLLAKDPDNLGYAEAMLKAAVAGGYHRTGEWIALLLFEANKASAKPSFAATSCSKMPMSRCRCSPRRWRRVNWRLSFGPHDDLAAGRIAGFLRQYDYGKGQIRQGIRFSRSINNKEAQDRLHSQENGVRSDEIKQKNVAGGPKTSRRAGGSRRPMCSNWPMPWPIWKPRPLPGSP
jgi:hypothetical protein